MNKLRKIFALVILAGTIISCGNKSIVVKDQPQNDSLSSSDSNATKENTVEWVSYEGVLSCNKCDGIKTSVSFSSDGQMASVSMSHLDNPFVEEGYDYPMNTERGFEKDPDATVYILNPDKPEKEQWIFVRETGDDSSILEIGTNRKKFKDKKNHKLVKVEQ